MAQSVYMNTFSNLNEMEDFYKNIQSDNRFKEAQSPIQDDSSPPSKLHSRKKDQQTKVKGEGS